MTQWRLYGAAAILVLLALVAHQCDRIKTVEPPIPSKPSQSQLILKPDEQEKVLVDTDKQSITIVTSTATEFHTGVRKAQIVLKKDGAILVNAPQFGWCFEPGIGVAVGDRIGIAADVQIAFWKRAGLIAGARLYPRPAPYLAAAYDLAGIHLSSTSVFGGIGLRRELILGVRVRI